MSSSPYVDPFPGQYEAADGVESTTPGANGPALRDPVCGTTFTPRSKGKGRVDEDMQQVMRDAPSGAAR
jgi:hypothetical protein